MPTEKDLQDYLTNSHYKCGNLFNNYLRKTAGIPFFEYTETYHGLQGTEACLKNNGSLNDMGDLGWEMMHVSDTKYPDVVSIIWKRKKIDTL